MNINKLPREIINKIIYYIDNDIDIINFLKCNKKTYSSYYLSLYKINKSNLKNIIILTKEYYEFKNINKKEYPNIKSYMYNNSLNPFKKSNYVFICKIYLDELIECNFLPKKGVIKIYLGINKIYDIYPTQIIYLKDYEKQKINDKIQKKINVFKNQRKYFIINKSYSLPLSYMRMLYIDKNLTTLAFNNDPVIENNEKFSSKYLFGYQTYYEKDPIKIINDTPQKSNDWTIFATFDPKYIFPKNEISKEMVSFIIRKKDLDFLNKSNVDKLKINTFAIYDNLNDHF